MTPEAYRAAVARLGLPLDAAGRWLGSERSSYRWAAEGAPRSVEIALNFALAFMDAGASLAEIKALAEGKAP
jgi:hypothetical protein